MSLIAVAADKGSPGVTTASVALAAIWPRPVLLAECDPSGGDLVYRLPAADGGPLDPRRGLLNVAVAARRGLESHQIWEHSQKLHGGLDVLTGVSGAEQGAGLELLWGAVGKVLAAVPQADVIADCGRLGADGPLYDLLAEAASVLLLTGATVGEVIRLRDRATALVTALGKRGRPAIRVNVVVVADYKNIGSAVEQVGQALRHSGAPGHVIGGLAYEPRSAEQLRGEWGGKLDKSMFIRTARAIAADLVAGLPELVQAHAQPSTGATPQVPVPDVAYPQPYYPPPGPAPQPQYQGPGPHMVPSGPHYPASPPPGPQYAPAAPPYPAAQPPAGPGAGPHPAGPGTGPLRAAPGTGPHPAGPGTGPNPVGLPGPPTQPAAGPQYAPSAQYAPGPAPGPQHPPAAWAQPRPAQPWPPTADQPGPVHGAPAQGTAQPGTGPHLLPHRSGRGRHAGRRGEQPPQDGGGERRPQEQQPEPTSGPARGQPGGR